MLAPAPQHTSAPQRATAFRCRGCGTSNVQSLNNYERFPCLAGVSDVIEPHPVRYDFEIGLCHTCGLVQQFQPPPEELLYLQARHGGVGPTWETHYDRFAALVAGVTTSTMRIAEIGSGNGKVARLLSARGRHITCYEPVPEFTGDDFIEVLPTRFMRSAPTYDCIISSHVLEHIEDVTEHLATVFDRLTEGGLICLAVPDFVEQLAQQHLTTFNTEHVSYFSATSLRMILAQQGFGDIHFETFPGHTLYAVARKSSERTAEAVQHVEIATTVERLAPAIVNYFDSLRRAGEVLKLRVQHPSSDGGERYLFGAHFMSSVVLFGLGIDRASFVGILDNDPLKTGKYLYGTDLCVSRPSAQITSPRATVFLNGGQYHAEIRSNLDKLGFAIAEWGVARG